jgi:hypothetical protein
VIDQKTPIEPPPSIEAILTHQGRIGRVDFSHRLAPEPEPTRDRGEDTARDTTEDTAAAAGTAGAAAEIAPAPSVEDLVGSTDDEARAQDRAQDRVQDRARLRDQDDDRLGLDPPLPPLRDAARVAATHPAVLDVPEADLTLLPRRDVSPQVSSLLTLVPAEDAATVTEDIDDVVDGVIARMREVQHTTLAHLEATEIEAALRAEMLTAQAELDAELIRLHARREAHAIIAAARQRSGLPMPARAEDQRRRLDQLGEAAVRLAEELDSLGADRGTPDQPPRR